jgi:DNA-binding CsgD family transcriptional regulator/anti-anti-sigma regulatory factor/anti-sigma regulatory factor (Ser/Thr protein kinase)
MAIVVDADRDLVSGVTTIRASGELTSAKATALQTALLRCVSECPTAVIVDVTGLDVPDPDTVAAFADASRQASAQWGVPLLIFGARPHVRRSISVYRVTTDVYDSRASALEALGRRPLRLRHEHFVPVPGSAAGARRLVAKACADWNLGDLHERAVLIASELAENAIEHAATEFDIAVSYTTAYLRIAVQDGGGALPPSISDHAGKPAGSGRGRGLRIVDVIASDWNAAGTAEGKIIWALLRAHPYGRPRGIGMARIAADGGSSHEGHAMGTDGASLPRWTMNEQLSDREREVLSYLPSMLTAGEIGVEMHLSVNTIKAHLRSIYAKLDVSRRQDAVFRAYEHGLLP